MRRDGNELPIEKKAHSRRYTGDRRSPKPFGRITQDTRVILASFFDPICGDDHPCISRSGAFSGSVARAAPVLPGVAAARSSPFSTRQSEQIQQGCARSCAPAGSQLGRRQVSEETGARARPARKGNRCQPSPPGACPSWLCSPRPGDRARTNPSPDNRVAVRSLRPGRVPARGGRHRVAAAAAPR